MRSPQPENVVQYIQAINVHQLLEFAFIGFLTVLATKLACAAGYRLVGDRIAAAAVMQNLDKYWPASLVVGCLAALFCDLIGHKPQFIVLICILPALYAARTAAREAMVASNWTLC